MSRSRTDVVQILLSPRIGGAESLAATLQHQWLCQGYSAQTVYLDPAEGPRRPLARLWHLWRALHRLRPRAVLAHSALPNVYARLAAPAGIAVCVVMHGGDDFADRKLRIAERVLRLRTSAVVVVNEVQRRQYVSRFGNSVTVHRIGNAIGSAIRPVERRPEMQQQRQVTAATVARVVPQKRPVFWVQVATACRHDAPQVRFDWWGPEGDDPESRSAITMAETEPNAAFRGSTSNPQDVYGAADLLFHPALAEAQSIGLLEAAATGLPIVCSDAVGATLDPRVPRTEYAGGDIADAVRSLVAVVNDLPAATRRALDAAPAIIEDYSAAACAAHYSELLGLDLER